MSTRLTPTQVRRQATAGSIHRNRLLVSTLDVLRTLRTGRWRVEDLAAELGLHKRAVYRVLNAIEAAGIKLEQQIEGAESHYRIGRATLMRAFRL